MNPKEQKREDGLMGHVEMSETVALLGRRYPTVSEVPLAVQILSGEPGEGGFDAGSAGSALYRLLTAGGTTPPPPTFTRNSNGHLNPDKLELGGYGWSVGTVDVSGTFDLETEKMSLLENIFEVQKIWGGWLVFDSINKTVSLRDDELWQRDTGFELRYAKNERPSRRSRTGKLSLRLYPFGEKDLNIAAVNDGKIYLENYSFTSRDPRRDMAEEDIYDQKTQGRGD